MHGLGVWRHASCVCLPRHAAPRSAYMLGTRVIARRLSTPNSGRKDETPHHDKLEQQQAELLRLLRNTAAAEHTSRDQRSLGLAGTALGAGAEARPQGTMSRWAAEGKPWKELRGGQKVARATLNTSRFTFIGIGAVIFAAIAYALSSELFAPNSPTVIYGEACKLIEKSPKVRALLLPPYSFQTHQSEYSGSYSPLNPPAHPHRPSQTVSSFVRKDGKNGRETMYLHFYMEGREKDHDLTYWQMARGSVLSGAHWAKLKLLEGWDVVVEWWNEAQMPEAPTAGPEAPAAAAAAASRKKSEPWWITRRWNDAVGGVSNFIGNTKDAFGMTTGSFIDTAGTQLGYRTAPGTWSTGEVSIEMVKDENGKFQYNHFHIDVPNAGASMRQRIRLDRRSGELPTR